MECCSKLIECGFTNPLPSITTNDKSLVIQTVALHCVLLQSKAETDQFCEGLSKLGVLNEIKKHPDIMRPMLTNSGLQHLTAGMELLELTCKLARECVFGEVMGQSSVLGLRGRKALPAEGVNLITVNAQSCNIDIRQ